MCHPATIATVQAKQKCLCNAKKAASCKAWQQKHTNKRLILKLQPDLSLNNPYKKQKLQKELQIARASGRVVMASNDKGRWKDEGAGGKEDQTSTEFFVKMQENVDSTVHGDGDGKGGEVQTKKKDRLVAFIGCNVDFKQTASLGSAMRHGCSFFNLVVSNVLQ
jgi:hypothetical protein